MIISNEKFDCWFKLGWNVLLRGRHGVGKTHIILQQCHQRNLKAQYFSTSTLDPWTDIIGIPRPKKITEGKYKGEEYIDFVRPLLFQRDELDVIILDELNRSNKKIRNALMELIQFRSINGKKFPRLKNIIGIINPEDDKETYDVEPMDPAQLDRFQIQIDVPFAPDEDYFVGKFGDNGRAAIEYWENLKELKEDVSPRRLEYALQMANEGYKEFITDVLPHRCLPQKLIQALDCKSISQILEELVKANDKKASRKWLANPNNFDNSIELISNSERYMEHFLTEMHKEKLMSVTRSCESVLKYVCDNFEKFPEYEKALSDIGEAVVADVERDKSAKEEATA
jgi:hypothetical protein